MGELTGGTLEPEDIPNLDHVVGCAILARRLVRGPRSPPRQSKSCLACPSFSRIRCAISSRLPDLEGRQRRAQQSSWAVSLKCDLLTAGGLALLVATVRHLRLTPEAATAWKGNLLSPPGSFTTPKFLERRLIGRD